MGRHRQGHRRDGAPLGRQHDDAATTRSSAPGTPRNDWFWQNIEIDSHEVFLGKVAEKGGLAAITVPIMGWVAKDTTSASFPVSVFGPQEKTDPDHPDFGNGKKPDGKTAHPAEASRRARAWRSRPEDVGDFVTKVRAYEKKRGKKLVFE